jgi:hypothetical protein
MATKEPGYVYILTNPSFREDWVKIGKSSRPVDVRSKELDNIRKESFKALRLWKEYMNYIRS